MPIPIDLAGVLDAALTEHKLPARKADRMYGGAGAGCICSICGRRIPQSTIQYDVCFDGDDREFHVHMDCYTAWERSVLAPRDSR